MPAGQLIRCCANTLLQTRPRQLNSSSDYIHSRQRNQRSWSSSISYTTGVPTSRSPLPARHHAMATLHRYPLLSVRHRPPPPCLCLLRRPLRPHRLVPRAAASSITVAESALQDFRRWLSSHGAAEGKAYPAAVPEGLGLVAARDLPRGEVVAEVPKKLWMDADAVAASDIGRACAGGDLRPWVGVTLLLLRELARGADSPWAPYLATLRRQTDSTIFW
jgi:[ribulose-bisphosphate carboxylase]/[fructose-bisphosphate aldolase]-lysine N-methyltransferase